MTSETNKQTTIEDLNLDLKELSLRIKS